MKVRVKFTVKLYNGGGSTVTVAQSLSPGNGLMKLDYKHNARYLRSVSVQVKGQQLQQHSHCARFCVGGESTVTAAQSLSPGNGLMKLDYKHNARYLRSVLCGRRVNSYSSTVTEPGFCAGEESTVTAAQSLRPGNGLMKLDYKHNARYLRSVSVQVKGQQLQQHSEESTVTAAQSLSPGNGLMKLDDKHNARYLRSVSVQVKSQQLQQHSEESTVTAAQSLSPGNGLMKLDDKHNARYLRSVLCGRRVNSYSSTVTEPGFCAGEESTVTAAQSLSPGNGLMKLDDKHNARYLRSVSVQSLSPGNGLMKLDDKHNARYLRSVSVQSLSPGNGLMKLDYKHNARYLRSVSVQVKSQQLQQHINSYSSTVTEPGLMKLDYKHNARYLRSVSVQVKSQQLQQHSHCARFCAGEESTVTAAQSLSPGNGLMKLDDKHNARYLRSVSVQSLRPGNGLMKLDDKHNARYLRSVSVQVKSQQLQQHSHCARVMG
ncbi:hypothetical protein J6590_050159 [Homalodisca vitripennis]|nr:hypothetical protein J6590_050159 [Homalodisca vitripennis]